MNKKTPQKFTPRRDSGQYVSKFKARSPNSDIKSTKSGQQNISLSRFYGDSRDKCLRYGHAPPEFNNLSKYDPNFADTKKYTKLLNEAKKLTRQLKGANLTTQRSNSGDKTNRSLNIRDEDVILNIDKRTVKRLLPSKIRDSSTESKVADLRDVNISIEESRDLFPDKMAKS